MVVSHRSRFDLLLIITKFHHIDPILASIEVVSGPINFTGKFPAVQVEMTVDEVLLSRGRCAISENPINIFILDIVVLICSQVVGCHAFRGVLCIDKSFWL